MMQQEKEPNDVEQAQQVASTKSGNNNNKNDNEHYSNGWLGNHAVLIGGLIIIFAVIAAVLLTVGFVVIRDDDDNDIASLVENVQCENAMTLLILDEDQQEPTQAMFPPTNNDNGHPTPTVNPSGDDMPRTWFHFVGKANTINGSDHVVQVQINGEAYVMLSVYQSAPPEPNGDETPFNATTSCAALVNLINGVSRQDVWDSNVTNTIFDNPLYHGVAKYGGNDWFIPTLPGVDYFVSVARVYDSQSNEFNISVTSVNYDHPVDELGLVDHDICPGAKAVDLFSNDNNTQRIQQNVVTTYARTSNPYGDWVGGSSPCLPTLLMGEVGHPNLWYRFTGTGDTVYVQAANIRPDILVYSVKEDTILVEDDCDNLEQIDRVCLDSLDTVFLRGGLPETANILLTIPTEVGQVYYVRAILSGRSPFDDVFDRALVFSLDDPTESACQDATEFSADVGLVNIRFNDSLSDMTVAPPSCGNGNDWYQWPGRWFFFVAEQDGMMQFNPQGVTSWDHQQQQMMVHSTCGSDANTQDTRIFDVCDIATGASWMEVNAGQRYYVYVAICPDCNPSDDYAFGGFQVVYNSE